MSMIFIGPKQKSIRRQYGVCKAFVMCVHTKNITSINILKCDGMTHVDRHGNGDGDTN